MSSRRDLGVPGYRTVLCGTDFSEPAGHATDWAIRFSARAGARLVVLHVVEYPAIDLEPFDVEFDFDAYRRSLVEDAEKRLADDIAARRIDDVRIDARVTQGISGAEVSRVAGDEEADLAVVGATGHSGLGRVVFGTTPEVVVRNSGCPVMVVRRAVPEGAFHHVLVATDFSPASAEALPHAAALADLYDARLTVLHVATVFPPNPYSPEIDESARAALEKAATAELAAIELPVEGLEAERRVVRALNAHEGILRTAEQSDADLIVVGTHGRSGLGGAFLGSTAATVVRHAHCPVLTVRPVEEPAQGAFAD